jgi:hypothetical protein
MVDQTLFIDYAGGRFESFFYQNAKRYPFHHDYDWKAIEKKAKRQGFNKLVYLDEAKIQKENV